MKMKFSRLASNMKLPTPKTNLNTYQRVSFRTQLYSNRLNHPSPDDFFFKYIIIPISPTNELPHYLPSQAMNNACFWWQINFLLQVHASRSKFHHNSRMESDRYKRDSESFHPSDGGGGLIWKRLMGQWWGKYLRGGLAKCGLLIYHLS